MTSLLQILEQNSHSTLYEIIYEPIKILWTSYSQKSRGFGPHGTGMIGTNT